MNSFILIGPFPFIYEILLKACLALSNSPYETKNLGLSGMYIRIVRIPKNAKAREGTKINCQYLLIE